MFLDKYLYWHVFVVRFFILDSYPVKRISKSNFKFKKIDLNVPRRRNKQLFNLLEDTATLPMLLFGFNQHLFRTNAQKKIMGIRVNKNRSRFRVFSFLEFMFRYFPKLKSRKISIFRNEFSFKTTQWSFKFPFKFLFQNTISFILACLDVNTHFFFKMFLHIKIVASQALYFSYFKSMKLPFLRVLILKKSQKRRRFNFKKKSLLNSKKKSTHNKVRSKKK